MDWFHSNFEHVAHADASIPTMELWIQFSDCLLQRIEHENENDEPVDKVMLRRVDLDKVDKVIIDKVMLRRVDLAFLMCSPPKKFEYNDA